MSNNDEKIEYKLGLDDSLLEKEARQASEIIQGIGDIADVEAARVEKHFAQADKAVDEFTIQLERHKNVLTELEKQYETVKAVFDEIDWQEKSAGLTVAREEATKLFQEIITEIESEKESLQQLEEQYAKLQQVTTDYNEKLRQSQEEIERLKDVGGEEVTDSKNRIQQINQLSNSYETLQESQKEITGDRRLSFDTPVKEIKELADVIDAAQSTFSLFGQESDKLAGIQKKLQDVITITIGIQKTLNSVNKTGKVLMESVAGATNIFTTIMNRFAVALNIAQVAAKGLTAKMTLGLSVVITGVMTLINNLIERQEKAAEQQRMLTDLYIEAGENVNQQKVEIEGLLTALHSEKLSIEEKSKVLKKLKDTVPDYNAEIGKTGEILNENVDAIDQYIKALEKKALVEAVQGKMVELMNKKLPIILEKKETEEKLKVFQERLKKVQQENSSKPQWFADGSTSFDGERGTATVVKMYEKDLTNLNKQEDKLDKEFEKLSDILKENVDGIVTGLIDTNVLNELKGNDKENTNAALTAQQWLLNRQGELNSEQEKLLLEHEERMLNIKVDSYEKQKQQNDLALEKEMQQIEAFQKKKAKEQEEYAKNLYIAENNTDKGFEFSSFKEESLPKGLTNEDIQKEVDRMQEAALSKYLQTARKLKEEQDKLLQEQNVRFADAIEQKKLTLENYYKDQLEKAKGNAELIAQLEKNKVIELNALKIDSELEIAEFKNSLAIRQLALGNKLYLLESNKQKEQLTLQRQLAKEKLDALKKKATANPTNNDLDREIEDATLALEELDDQIEKLLLERIKEALAYVGQLAKGIGDLAGDSSLGTGMGWVSDFAGAAGDIAAGIISMNPAQMIQGVFKVAGVVKDMIKLNREANKEIKEFQYSLQQAALQYSIALIGSLKDIQSVKDSIFYEDKINTLTQGMTSYAAAVEKEKELVQQLGDTTVQVGVKKKKFLGITTGTKKVYEDLLTGYKKVLNTDEELIDANGNLNRELAQSLLNSGKLSKEATDLINNILEAADAAETAIQQVEAVLSDLAGSVGDDLKDALIEAFREGTDAAEAFKTSVTSIMEDIISDFLFAQYFGELLNDLENRMKQSYGHGGDQDIIDDLIWFADAWQKGQAGFNTAMEKIQEEMQKKGFDLFSAGDVAVPTATAKGFATASQDSIEELNGRFTVIQSHTFNINENVQLLANNSSSILNHLSGIQNNTEHCRRLVSIESDMSSVKQELQYINLHGIELKR